MMRLPHATSAHMAQGCIVAAILLAGLSSLLLALNHVVTIINMRSRDISLQRLPLFVWTQLIAAAVMLLFLPMLAGAATVHLWRMMPALPVSPIAWHAMHPLAYVMMLPCLGIVAEAVRPSIAVARSIRLYVAYALLSLGLLGFVIWAHVVLSASAGAWPDWLAVTFSALIVATLLPMIVRCHPIGAGQLWAFGALFVFATGIAADAALLLTHASQAFVHFCFVLSIGCLFSGFAGTYMWLGRSSGRRLPEFWGIAHFLTAFVGLNLALLPAHVLLLVPRLAGIINPGTSAVFIAAGTLVFFLSLGLFAVVLLRSAAASDSSAADAWALWIPQTKMP